LSPEVAAMADTTSLQLAAHRGDISTIRSLLDHGISPDVRNKSGETALLVATHANQTEAARLLIEAGVDVDHVNKLGWTALLQAVILGDGGPRHVAIVKLLVDAGANKVPADRDGITALQHARARGFKEIAAILQ
jgi:ankyrin repeat protein